MFFIWKQKNRSKQDELDFQTRVPSRDWISLLDRNKWSRIWRLSQRCAKRCIGQNSISRIYDSIWQWFFGQLIWFSISLVIFLSLSEFYLNWMGFKIGSIKSNEEFQPKVVKRYEPIVEENEEVNSPRDSKTMRNIKIVIPLIEITLHWSELIEELFPLKNKSSKNWPKIK